MWALYEKAYTDSQRCAMNYIPLFIAACLFVTRIGFGQSGPAAQEVSAFENFVNEPNSRVTWSTEIGRIDSPDAQAVITAISVVGSSPNREMRGVRMHLTRGASKDRIYVERRYVKQLSDVLVEIDEMAPRFLARRVGQSSCFGSGVFLRAFREGANFFHASSCQNIEGFTGLRVDTGSQSFRFATADLKRFIALLDSAAAELESR
jgi:hypothetical protein